MKNTRNGFGLIGLLVVLALIGGGVYLTLKSYRPSTNVPVVDTSNPIQQAENAKNAVEQRNRDLMKDWAIPSQKKIANFPIATFDEVIQSDYWGPFEIVVVSPVSGVKSSADNYKIELHGPPSIGIFLSGNYRYEYSDYLGRDFLSFEPDEISENKLPKIADKGAKKSWLFFDNPSRVDELFTKGTFGRAEIMIGSVLWPTSGEGDRTVVELLWARSITKQKI